MSRLEKLDLLRNAKNIQTSTHALGGGDWSIEVMDGDEFLFELVGSNGTRSEADDLWGQLADLQEQVKFFSSINPK